MKARHRQNSNKKITFERKEYTFGPDWADINDIGLLKRLKQFPGIFDVVCHFDYRKFAGFEKSIVFRGGKIITSDKSAIKKIQRMPFIRLSCTKPETGEHVFKITNYSDKKLSSYSNEKSLNVLIFRKLGGLGDIIMTFPVIEYIKKKNPNYKITYSCPEEFLCLANNNPFIDNLLPYSNEVTQIKWDHIIDLTTDCIKYEIKNQPNVKLNRSEIFMQSVGYPAKETPKPKLYLSDTETTYQNFNLNYKQIAIVLESNAPVRSWDKIYELRDKLLKDDSVILYEICKGEPKKYKNTDKTVKCFDHTLREIAYLFTHCDLVIGPDTGPMHMAAALGVPTLWLFTHIDGSIRTKNYDSDTTNFIQGECDYDK